MIENRKTDQTLSFGIKQQLRSIILAMVRLAMSAIQTYTKYTRGKCKSPPKVTTSNPELPLLEPQLLYG